MANLPFEVTGDVTVDGNYISPDKTVSVPASTLIPNNQNVTSNIQTQINGLATLNNSTLTSANLISSNLQSNTFVAIQYSGTTSAASSTDGITWTLRTMPNASYWYGVTYGNGTFVAVAYTSTSAASSTDGITWTLRTMPNASNWISVTSAPTQSLINSQSIQGQVINSITTPTYTVGPYDKYIILNTTAACTLTLPNAGLYPNREITIKQIGNFLVNSSTSNVFPLATNTAGTGILSSAGKFATLISDGYFWIIRESN